MLAFGTLAFSGRFCIGLQSSFAFWDWDLHPPGRRKCRKSASGMTVVDISPWIPFPPIGSVLLEVQRKSVLEYLCVHLLSLRNTLDMKFQGICHCCSGWSGKQWKMFADCLLPTFSSVPWSSRSPYITFAFPRVFLKCF